jgi:polyisoprenoid-binding protein YceI
VRKQWWKSESPDSHIRKYHNIRKIPKIQHFILITRLASAIPLHNKKQIIKTMKKLTLTLAILLNGILLFAQNPQWSFEKSHCKIAFTVAHFGISETDGQFKKFDGTINTTKDDFSDAKIDFVVDVNSINTDDEQRDGHLKSADFFDVAKYPNIVFKSKSFKPVGKNKYKLAGDFTMHGVTKPVTFDVIYGGTIAKDPFGNTKAGFKLTGEINRKDWGLVWNKALDAGGVAVGDEVKIVANIELLKAKPALVSK